MDLEIVHEFDNDEEFYCQRCSRKIMNFNDGVWVTPIDEETGEEIQEESEVFCNACSTS